MPTCRPTLSVSGRKHKLQCSAAHTKQVISCYCIIEVTLTCRLYQPKQQCPWLMSSYLIWGPAPPLIHKGYVEKDPLLSSDFQCQRTGYKLRQRGDTAQWNVPGLPLEQCLCHINVCQFLSLPSWIPCQVWLVGPEALSHGCMSARQSMFFNTIIVVIIIW